MTENGEAALPARRRRSILFVHHRSELGGAPTSLAYLIRELDRDEFEATVFCPPGPAADLFRSVGARVEVGPVASFTHIWASVYGGRRWLLLVRELTLLPGHIRAFRRVLRSQHFDLVHLNDSPLIPAAWLARMHGLPVVWHLRSALPFDGNDLRSRVIRKIVISTGSAAIAITGDIEGIFRVGATVVPNSIDLTRFVPSDDRAAKEALGFDPDLPVVSYFGFVYPSKGYPEFLEAAALLRERGIDAAFAVVGGAVRSSEFFRSRAGRVLLLLDLARDYDSEARAHVEKLGLTNSVRFVPFTNEIQVYYQASDVVVAPSRGWELGRPVIEAAASGVPVVASGSRTGGSVIVPGETGVLAGSTQPAEIAEAVAGLLSDAELRRRMGRAARQHALESFDPAENARKIESIYREITATGRIAVRERIPVLYVEVVPTADSVAIGFAEVLARLADQVEAHAVLPAGPAADALAAAGVLVHRVDAPTAALLRMQALLLERDFAVLHAFDAAAARTVQLAPRRPIVLIHAATGNVTLIDRARAERRILDGVYPAVDLERFQPRDPVAARAALGLDPGRLTVGLHGLPFLESGLVDFQRAARLARLAGADAQFLVVREGGSGRSPHTGGVDVLHDVEAADYLAALDVVVYPRRRPGAVLPIVQAAAAGRAAVVSGWRGGIEAAITGAALVTPPRAPAAIGAAVTRLVGDDALRRQLGSQARRHATELFDPDRNARSLLTAYEQALVRS